jgi:tetratricopeptide (TPR) repeat protein
MLSTDITGALENMPPHASSEYHARAGALCDRLTEEEMAALEELITAPGDRKRAFDALYVLLARHRRVLDPGRFRRLYERHAGNFDDMPMRAVLDSDMAMLHPGGPDLPGAVAFATRALDAYPNNQPLVAHHARVPAELGWSGAEVPEAELNQALARVERSIEADPERARFRAVKGQLCALLGRYEEAEAAIQRAMELEDSSLNGYAIRVIEYQRLRADIRLRAETGRIREALRDTTRRLEREMDHRLTEVAGAIRQREEAEIAKLRSESLGTLGLLAAVIAFIVTSVQVADKMPLTDGLRLLAGIAGVLTLVFTVFAGVYAAVRSWWLVAPVLLGGALFAYASFG